MSGSEWTRWDVWVARIQSNEETSFDYSLWFYLPIEDVSRRLGAFLLDNIASCALRSLRVRAEYLLVEPVSESDKYPLLEYLRSNQCGLTELKLDCVEIPDEVQGLLHRIPSALLANQSITRLELKINQDEPTAVSFVKNTLDTLAVSPLATLQELNLDFNSFDESNPEALREVLTVYFQLCPTNLRRLMLRNTCITSKSCELLFQTSRACPSKRSHAERVSFIGCNFEREANESMGELLESEKIQEGDAGAGVIEVTFDTNDWCVCEFSMPPCLLGCFRVPRDGRIRVVEFTVNSDGSSHLPLVAYHLPVALYMRKLEVLCGAVFSDEQEERLDDACQRTIPAAFLNSADSLEARQLLNGIRRNGSLHEFILNDEDMITPDMNRKLQAYLTRNREVPQLLSRPCIGGDQDDQTDDATTSAGQTKTDLTCFPPPHGGCYNGPGLVAHERFDWPRGSQHGGTNGRVSARRCQTKAM